MGRPYAPLMIQREHPAGNWLRAAAARPKEAEAIARRAGGKLNADITGWDAEKVMGQLAAETWALSPGYDYAMHHVASGRETQLLRLMRTFDIYGKAICSFAPGLTEELANTDLDDARMRDLFPPATCLYVAYDGGAARMPDGREIDGFLFLYASATDTPLPLEDLGTGGKRIFEAVILPRRNDWSKGPSLPIVISIPIDDLDEPIMAAVRRHLDADLALLERNYRNHWVKPGSDVSYLAANYAATKRAIEDTRRCAEELHRMMVGSLLYLSSYHDQGEDRWPTAAPDRLVRKAQEQDARGKAAVTELAARGWTRIRYFDIARQRGAGTTAGSTATHWRRGHWRRQACGVGLTERRMRWIRPTMINAHPDAEVPVREYLADRPATGTIVDVRSI